MSSPSKAQPENPMSRAIRLLLLRRHQLHLLFFLPPKTSSPNSWRCLWRQPRLGSSWSHGSAHSKLGPRRPISENLTWIATIFVSNVRIISKPQALQGWIVSPLLPPFSVVSSASDVLNTSAATNAPLPSRGQNPRPSFEKTSEAPKPLLTASRVSLGRTLNTNWKKPKTGNPTFNTSNPSYQSLIRFGPPTN